MLAVQQKDYCFFANETVSGVGEEVKIMGEQFDVMVYVKLAAPRSWWNFANGYYVEIIGIVREATLDRAIV